MACTVTVVKKPTATPDGIKARFSLAFITSTTANGEPFDITDYFTTVESIKVGGVDAAADATWTFQAVYPGVSTAISSTNTVMTATHGSGADAVNNHADAEDLSTVGALIIDVVGTGKIATSWA